MYLVLHFETTVAFKMDSRARANIFLPHIFLHTPLMRMAFNIKLCNNVTNL